MALDRLRRARLRSCSGAPPPASRRSGYDGPRSLWRPPRRSSRRAAAEDRWRRTSDELPAFGRSMEAMPQSWRPTMHPGGASAPQARRHHGASAGLMTTVASSAQRLLGSSPGDGSKNPREAGVFVLCVDRSEHLPGRAGIPRFELSSLGEWLAARPPGRAACSQTTTEDCDER